MLPGERKSVEPMAARVEPGRVGAAHRDNERAELRPAEWLLVE